MSRLLEWILMPLGWLIQRLDQRLFDHTLKDLEWKRDLERRKPRQ
jgi:hypothetical protein